MEKLLWISKNDLSIVPKYVNFGSKKRKDETFGPEKVGYMHKNHDLIKPIDLSLYSELQIWYECKLIY